MSRKTNPGGPSFAAFARRLPWLLALGWLAGAFLACSPTIPTGTPASASGSPAPSPTPIESVASLPIMALPAPSVVARIALTGVVDLAPAADGVWYVRIDGSGGHVGLATTTGSVREAPAGPAPAAIAEGSGAVYVVEGTSDRGQAARTNVVERLDPQTLQVEASRAVTSPTDVVVTDGTVWVATTRTGLVAFGPDLAELATVPLAGSGPARAAASADRIWVLNGRADPPVHLLHAVALPDRTDTTVEIAGGGSFGALAVDGMGIWVGTLGAGAGLGHLVQVDRDLAVRAVATIPAPADLAVLGDRVWWIGVDGQVGTLDPTTGTVGGAIGIGATGACLTASGGAVWACADDLFVLRVAP